MLAGLAFTALAIYAAYRYNSASGTPQQRRSQREAWMPYIWAGVGGAFAAGTPLMAGGAGGGAASTAATTGAEVSTAAATGTAGTAGTTAATAGQTSSLVATEAGLELTVAASALPPVAAATAPAIVSGPTVATAVGVGASAPAVNLVRGEAPQETTWQKILRGEGRERGNASDWLDQIGTPQQRRQEDEIIEQPPAPDVDYRAIAQEQERRRLHEETIGQQEHIPEGRHGERRWGDWWGT